jgi:hypothetical protein
VSVFIVGAGGPGGVKDPWASEETGRRTRQKYPAAIQWIRFDSRNFMIKEYPLLPELERHRERIVECAFGISQIDRQQCPPVTVQVGRAAADANED